MDEEQDRVVDVLAPDFNPLLDAADLDRLKAVDAMGRTNGALYGDLILQIFSINQGR
jgi:hypothetical protein